MVLADLPAVTLPGGTDLHAVFAFGFKGRENPPFDPRRYSTNPWYANVRQGLMIQDQPSTSGQIEKLRFLYNPSDYQLTYDASSDAPPTGDASNPADTASVLGATHTSTGFSLLFDRTYELWDGNTLKDSSAGHTPFAQPAGVDVDLLAFRRLVGIPDDQNGQMLYVPIHVYLGSTLAPHFLGYITGAQIAYTHFTSAMIPARAVISIQMVQVLTPSTGSTDAPGSTTANTPGSSTGGTPPPPATSPGTVPPPAPAPPPPPPTVNPTDPNATGGVPGGFQGG